MKKASWRLTFYSATGMVRLKKTSWGGFFCSMMGLFLALSQIFIPEHGYLLSHILLFAGTVISFIGAGSFIAIAITKERKAVS